LINCDSLPITVYADTTNTVLAIYIPEMANLQLILYMQHACPDFHLGALSCFKLKAHSERLAIDVKQISTTRARYIH